MSEKKSPFAVWAVASQMAFVILAPLLVFIVGGHYIVERYSLPDWVMVICIILGILFMISGAINHIMKMIRLFAKDDKSKYRSYYSDRRDNDYYDDHGHQCGANVGKKIQRYPAGTARNAPMAARNKCGVFRRADGSILRLRAGLLTAPRRSVGQYRRGGQLLADGGHG